MSTPPPIFVRADLANASRLVVPTLARWMGLDIWGVSLLTTSGVRRMRIASYALLAVFLFECVAWTLLFNVITNGAAWGIGWGTPLAFAFGLLFAASIFLFEQGLVTGETGWAARTLAILGGRLLLVALSALVTAQPMELLVFNQEIQERLRDEGLLDLALAEQRRTASQLATERVADPEAEATARLEGGPEHTRLVEAREALRQVGDVVALEAAGLEVLGRRKAELEGRIAQAQEEAAAASVAVDAAATSEERAAAEARLASARAGEQSWQRQFAELGRQVIDRRYARSAGTKIAEEHFAEHTAADKAYNAKHAEIVAAIRRENDDLRDMVRQRDAVLVRILAAPAGEVVVGPDWTFDPYTAGFIRRLRVLDDLRVGREPAWPIDDEAAKAEALNSSIIASIANPSRDRLARMRDALGWRYWGAAIVACFLPLLSVLTKLTLLGKELAAYYSIEAQARAGNPEASRVLRALEEPLLVGEVEPEAPGTARRRAQRAG